MTLVSTAQEQSVLSILASKVEAFAERPALCIKRGQSWVEVSYAELARRARRLATCLIADGLQPGDRLAICAESGPEWGICFFAGIYAGAVVVPVDHKLGVAELTTILTDCTPRFLCVSAPLQDTAQTVQGHVPEIERIMVLDEDIGDNADTSIDRHHTPELLPDRGMIKSCV
jgi:long-subunit acyl-CoA synthetase (AMP-forming)